eukprot:3030856-Rhodomonas_salina.1
MSASCCRIVPTIAPLTHPVVVLYLASVAPYSHSAVELYPTISRTAPQYVTQPYLGTTHSVGRIPRYWTLRRAGVGWY